MNPPDDILSQALDLPLSDRASLARDLLVSLEASDFDDDAEGAWAAEIETRMEKVSRGEFSATEWRESVERVRRELANRRKP